jgi:hypothetical protein
VIHTGVVPGKKQKERGFTFGVFERLGGAKCEPNRHQTLLRGLYLLPIYHVEKTGR